MSARGQTSFVPPVAGTTEDDQDRRTPIALVTELARRFGRGRFSFDAACVADNCVVCADQDDGGGWCLLRHPVDSLAPHVAWEGSVWCNSPWDNIEPFIRKARREVDNGNADVVVFLLPARTTMPWYIWALANGFRMYPIAGRVAYGRSGDSPFEHSIVLVYDRPIEAGDFR